MRRPLGVRRREAGLMRFDDALTALGHDGEMGRRYDEVPLANVVGTLARPHDFDAEFRLRNAGLTDRWRRLADAVDDGFDPPPVDLVQLGELYFVRDGHHRISVAKALGRGEVVALVSRICTIAYAMACLRAAHLASKAAEREFLERVPLPDDVREDLWLDRPEDWPRLAAAAHAWGRDIGTIADRRELAGRWWDEEVTPLVHRMRASGRWAHLRDVQLYVTARALT